MSAGRMPTRIVSEVWIGTSAKKAGRRHFLVLNLFRFCAFFPLNPSSCRLGGARRGTLSKKKMRILYSTILSTFSFEIYV